MIIKYFAYEGEIYILILLMTFRRADCSFTSALSVIVIFISATIHTVAHFYDANHAHAKARRISNAQTQRASHHHCFLTAGAEAWQCLMPL